MRSGMRSWSKCVIFSRRMKSSSSAGPRSPALSEFWLSATGTPRLVVSGRSEESVRTRSSGRLPGFCPSFGLPLPTLADGDGFGQRAAGDGGALRLRGGAAGVARAPPAVLARLVRVERHGRDERIGGRHFFGQRVRGRRRFLLFRAGPETVERALVEALRARLESFEPPLTEDFLSAWVRHPEQETGHASSCGKSPGRESSQRELRLDSVRNVSR